MASMASQITNLTIVYSAVYSGAYQRKHQSSALLAFVRGIHRGQVNSPHKWPVMQKMFPFDDVIMNHPADTAEFSISGVPQDNEFSKIFLKYIEYLIFTAHSTF